MRVFALGLIFSALALPCVAQTVLKSEPLGAIRGLHRRKACVPLAAEQASLAVATP